MTPQKEKKFGTFAGIHAISVLFFFINLGLTIIFGILTLVFGLLKGQYEVLQAAFPVMLILLIVFASLLFIFFILTIVFTVKTHNQAFVTTAEDREHEPSYTHHI